MINSDKDVMIVVRNLTTGYKGRHGMKEVTIDISGDIYSGEMTCLLGPNGAGKSTLLRTLCGFQKSLGGTVMIEGRNIKDYSSGEISRIIGVVLTEKLMLSNMTVRQLVEMGRSPYTGFWGKLSEEDDKIVDESIALTGIEHLAGRMIQTLSDGERQKMLIAKAIAQETPIIFLDEPTAFLDYPSKVELMQLLHILTRTKKKTIVLSTHDLELVLQIADRLWLIDKKLGLTVGKTDELAESGTVGNYFEREGIKFDTASRTFKIDSIGR